MAFGGVWKESLTELSGGQRSLLALSLILAMLLFKPAPIYILDEARPAARGAAPCPGRANVHACAPAWRACKRAHRRRGAPRGRAPSLRALACCCWSSLRSSARTRRNPAQLCACRGCGWTRPRPSQAGLLGAG